MDGRTRAKPDWFEREYQVLQSSFLNVRSPVSTLLSPSSENVYNMATMPPSHVGPRVISRVAYALCHALTRSASAFHSPCTPCVTYTCHRERAWCGTACSQTVRSCFAALPAICVGAGLLAARLAAGSEHRSRGVLDGHVFSCDRCGGPRESKSRPLPSTAERDARTPWAWCLNVWIADEPMQSETCVVAEGGIRLTRLCCRGIMGSSGSGSPQRWSETMRNIVQVATADELLPGFSLSVAVALSLRA